MNLAELLSTYLTLNFLLLLGFLGLATVTYVVAKWGRRFSASDELRLHDGVLFLILLLAVAHPFFPKNEVFRPAAKVWSASSIKSFSEDYKASDRSGFLSVSTPRGTSTVKAGQVAIVWALLGAGLFLCGSFFQLRDLRRLLAIKRGSYRLRKLGKVRLYINDEIRVPFSYWLPGEASVVIPSALLTRSADLKMAIAHELQHHRRGDTRWIYVLWILRLTCALNPAIHFWNRWIMEVQEFACDETLIGRKRFQSRDYARCLIEVAQNAIDQKGGLVCATGLTFQTERNLLKRRIERMFSKSNETVNRKFGISLAVGIALVMSVATYASKGLVQDRRVGLSQAKAMATIAQAAQSEQGIPIVVNDLVLKQLNRYIGTPEGREFMRNALARQANHKAVVSQHLEKYQVPMEIMALPIVESGYQNLAQGEGSPTNKSAGLWQFIPQTARNYGLRVDTQKDERLDTVLLTDAAMRYLQANNLRFKDWQLSLMAYNMGENAVQKAMVDLDTRDAWTLIRNGREGDKDYLAKFMAAVLIMRNPDSVE